MKNYKIILARYNENIKWADDFKNIIVYNKGEQLETKHELVNLVNYGHEAHTYLTYIVNNYDKLADIICFFQANPHIEKFLNCKENQITEEKLIEKFINIKKYSSENFEERPLNFHLTQNFIDNNLNYRIFEYPSGNKLSLYKTNALTWFKDKINNQIEPSNLKMYIGANFSVRKEAILSRSLNFYRDLLMDFHFKHCELAHFCERSWYYIFNLDKFEFEYED